jgi:hypothetical protein
MDASTERQTVEQECQEREKERKMAIFGSVAFFAATMILGIFKITVLNIPFPALGTIMLAIGFWKAYESKEKLTVAQNKLALLEAKRIVEDSGF